MWWHPYGGRRWPLTAVEERVLVAELAEWEPQTPPTPTLGPAAVAALLAMLRSGVALDSLLAQLPRLPPGRLRWAYERLERLRAEAAAACARLWEAETAAQAQAELWRARLLVPAASAQVRVRAPTRDAEVAVKVAELGERARQEAQAAADVEARMAASRNPARCRQLGATLYHPGRPCLWSRPLFVPPRVGALTPGRVRALLRADW